MKVNKQVNYKKEEEKTNKQTKTKNRFDNYELSHYSHIFHSFQGSHRV